MSAERSSWDKTDRSRSEASRGDLPGGRTGSRFASELGSDFDFEDVGPTEIQASRFEPELDDGASSYEPFQAGEIVGQYRVERVLGRGAMGIVYQASHVAVDRRSAVKCLFPHAAEQPVQVQRLFQEAEIAARVNHPNVVQVFDAGRHRDTYYLAMELLEGQTLAELLAAGQPSIEVIVTIFLQVMSGVAAVHKEGVVHRDLKPENIFMQTRPGAPDDPGVPKVLDFGVSKLYEQGRTKKLTAMGVVMGTPFYMATEQVVDTSAVDQRADVYSLGVMLYEAITGALPYPGRSVVEVFAKAEEGRPLPIREVRPNAPPSLEALVARALCADREARGDSVDEMRLALGAVPLDGSDEWEEWSDVSQPWMLDQANADLHDLGRPPREKPVIPASMPTPLSHPRLPSIKPPQLGERDVPMLVWLLVAAAAGSLAAALGAVILYFALA